MIFTMTMLKGWEFLETPRLQDREKWVVVFLIYGAYLLLCLKWDSRTHRTSLRVFEASLNSCVRPLLRIRYRTFEKGCFLLRHALICLVLKPSIRTWVFSVIVQYLTCLVYPFKTQYKNWLVLCVSPHILSCVSTVN